MKKIFEPLVIELNQFPQDERANETAQRRILDPSSSLSGVYRYYDRYQSRVSIGQQQYTLATGTIHACLRLTDAALLYFWGYRKRPQRNPIDTDFNIGLDVAQRDLENCEWLRKYLEDVEQIIISEGLLDATAKRSITSARGQFDRAKFHIFWSGFHKEAQKFLTELQRNGEPARVLHAVMSEQLCALTKTIDTADRAIIKPASMEPRDPSLDQAL